jgi:hypothetical protein
MKIKTIPKIEEKVDEAMNSKITVRISFLLCPSLAAVTPLYKRLQQISNKIKYINKYKIV